MLIQEKCLTESNSFGVGGGLADLESAQQHAEEDDHKVLWSVLHKFGVMVDISVFFINRVLVRQTFVLKTTDKIQYRA